MADPMDEIINNITGIERRRKPSKEKKTATARYIAGGRSVEVKYSTGAVAHFLPETAKAARKALNELHRAEKAKQVERRFYVKEIDERRCGVVDRNLIDMCVAIFYATALQKDSHTINAKAFAKLLNKQERKRLACNTVTPDTEEEL